MAKKVRSVFEVMSAIEIAREAFEEMRDEAKEQREFLMADKLDDGVRLCEIVLKHRAACTP